MTYRSRTRHTTECVEAGEAYACEGECAMAGQGAAARNLGSSADGGPPASEDLRPGDRWTDPAGVVHEWGGRGWRSVTAAELRLEAYDRQRYGVRRG